MTATKQCAIRKGITACVIPGFSQENMEAKEKGTTFLRCIVEPIVRISITYLSITPERSSGSHAVWSKAVAPAGN